MIDYHYRYDEFAIAFRGNKDPAITGSASPNFREKLRAVVGDGIIVCPASDHSGGVITLGKNHFNGSDEIFNGTGDAFIIILPADYQGKVHAIVRTRDCGNIVGIISTENLRVIFGVHSSNQTEFGCDAFDIRGNPTCQASFHGPITKRVLTMLRHLMKLDLNRCQVFIGPSLGGSASECDCYEYTQTRDRPDGVKLCQDIRRAYPGISLDGLVGHRVDADKMTFQMGDLTQRILETSGIPRKNIHMENNLCTLCSPGHHSDRRSRHDILDRSERPNNLAIITFNGN